MKCTGRTNAVGKNYNLLFFFSFIGGNSVWAEKANKIDTRNLSFSSVEI